MRKERKHYTAEEKRTRHPVDKAPVADLCEELGLQPISTVGRRSSSRTERPPFSRRSVPAPGGGETQKIELLAEQGADQGRSHGRVDGGAPRGKQNIWGTLTGSWVLLTCGTKWWISSHRTCWRLHPPANESPDADLSLLRPASDGVTATTSASGT